MHQYVGLLQRITNVKTETADSIYVSAIVRGGWSNSK